MSYDIDYLTLLSQQYPTVKTASTEIIRLQSRQKLPKLTEHFMSDVHCEYDAFNHVLRNGSGSIKEKLRDCFPEFSATEISSLATLIYYPQEKLDSECQLKETEEFETKDAIANGASEIDMVINIGWLKDKKYDLVEEEIRTLKAACGEKILKVIIETCLLTEEEKIKMCELVTNAGADYIKTSTCLLYTSPSPRDA